MMKRETSNILERSLGTGLKNRNDINLSSFALLFSAMVQYSQNRVNSVPELEGKLSDFGRFVGSKLVDLVLLRERGYKRETELLKMLMNLKSNVWKSIFGKEADKLEMSNQDPCMYLISETDSLVNTFISVPKEMKDSLNCGAFTAGVVEAILCGCNFPCRVTAHRHLGTTYMIKFEQEVIMREQRQTER